MQTSLHRFGEPTGKVYKEGKEVPDEEKFSKIICFSGICIFVRVEYVGGASRTESI
jgi:hypothetical protein